MKTLTMAMMMAFGMLTAASGQVKMNVKAGVGTSSFVGMGASERLAYKLGGGVDVPIWKHVSFQPSLYHARKGADFGGYYGNEQIMEATFRQKLDYLEVPLLIAFKINLSHNATLMLKTGGYAAYGLRGRTSVDINNTDGKVTFSENHFAEQCNLNGMAFNSNNKSMTIPQYERLDLGAAGGIELKVGHLLIGGELDLGLRPLCDKNYTDDDVTNAVLNILSAGVHGKPKNTMLTFTLGYEF